MTVTEIAVEKNIPFYILIRNTWENSNQIGYYFLLHKKKELSVIWQLVPIKPQGFFDVVIVTHLNGNYK